jgi:hypothetical protein
MNFSIYDKQSYQTKIGFIFYFAWVSESDPLSHSSFSYSISPICKNSIFGAMIAKGALSIPFHMCIFQYLSYGL